MKEAIIVKGAPAAVGPYSHSNKGAGLVFVSGQIPVKDGVLLEDITEASRACLENLKTVLEGSGSSLEKVLKVTVFLTDMADFAKMNEVYAEYFSENYPARSAIAVKALPKGAIVEMEAIALA